MFRRVIDEFGTLDILVNNAGLQRDVPLVEMSLEEWHESVIYRRAYVVHSMDHVVEVPIPGGAGAANGVTARGRFFPCVRSGLRRRRHEGIGSAR
jgi:hypothetical protein